MRWLFDRSRREWLAGGTGALASLVCGIHCLALPVFSAMMFFAGIGLHAQVSLELALMGGSFALAMLAFLPAALAGRNSFALQAAAFALVFFLAAWQMSALGVLVRQSLSISSSLLLLVAHGQNLWQLRYATADTECSLQHCQPQA